MNIVKTKMIWIIFSVTLMIFSIFFIFSYKLPMGIDFSGGTELEFQVKSNEPKYAVEEKIKSADVKNINLRDLGQTNQTDQQGSGGEWKSYSLKSEELNNEQGRVVAETIGELGEYKEVRRETVGPAVSKDLTKKAIIAVILASIMIIIYIAWSFRLVPKPANSWRFGTTAVVALLHDLLITTGAMALYGHFYGFEIDSLFITAMLTIMGFSVHDTIVVFDRLRENLKQSPSLEFEINANNAIVQTISRSLNTSLTVIITLLALFLLGGESIHRFTLTLLVGITIGTYSSIFVATILLVFWQQWSHQKNIKKSQKIDS